MLNLAFINLHYYKDSEWALFEDAQQGFLLLTEWELFMFTLLSNAKSEVSGKEAQLLLHQLLPHEGYSAVSMMDACQANFYGLAIGKVFLYLTDQAVNNE